MKLDQVQLISLSSIAKSAAIEAGEYIQSQFDQKYEKHGKTGGDSLASQVVTEVDFKAQEIVLKHLNPTLKQFSLGLLTEESEDDQSRLTKDYFWCIDPLDGTLPFTEHRTGYSVSIALIDNIGDPVIGVVYIPDLKDCYLAVKGAGVSLNDSVFERSEEHDSDIDIFMDSSFLEESYRDFVERKFQKLAEREDIEVRYHTVFGGVRNGISIMNTNRACYFKFPRERKGGGSIWDYAATRLMFEELGLVVLNANGNKLHLNDPASTFMNKQGILFAADEILKDFILDLYNQWKSSVK